MIPWLTLGVSLTSLLILLILCWKLRKQEPEEVAHAVGFRFEPDEDLDNEDGA